MGEHIRICFLARVFGVRSTVFNFFLCPHQIGKKRVEIETCREKRDFDTKKSVAEKESGKDIRKRELILKKKNREKREWKRQ